MTTFPGSLEAQPLNPFLSMWIRPRATMRQILDSDPQYLVIVLAMVGGVVNALNHASIKNMGDQAGLGVILMVPGTVGPLGGLIRLYLGVWRVSWTGRCMGGTGSAEHIRCAIAWGSVPALWVGILWLPELVVFGDEMFTTEMPSVEGGSIGLVLLLVVLGLTELVGGIWAIVTSLKCTAEAHGFSAWMALLNWIIAGLIIIVPVLFIVMFLFMAALA